MHTSPLALLLHRKVTLRISIMSTKLLFSFKERIVISILREKNLDLHFSKNYAALAGSQPKTVVWVTESGCNEKKKGEKSSIKRCIRREIHIRNKKVF